MTATALLFFLGLVMLILGGDSLVGYASSLARRLKIPPLLMGATLVSVGTTLPELSIASAAAVNGCGDIAAGTALGSIICNSCLVGGIGALCFPLSGLRRRHIMKNLLFFLLAACFTAFSVMKTGQLGTSLGIVLLSIFAVYALACSKTESAPMAEGENERPELICFGLIVGAAALYIGSGLLLDNAVLMAEELHLPQKTVAGIFIALGTSLPELVTAVVSIIKKQSSIALGNIIGANIMNLLLVIGLPSILAPMAAGREIYRDLSAAALSMLLLTVPTALTGKTHRWQGALLLAAYAAYTGFNLI